MKEFNYKMKHSQAMPNGYYKCMSLGKRMSFSWQEILFFIYKYAYQQAKIIPMCLIINISNCGQR